MSAPAMRGMRRSTNPPPVVARAATSPVLRGTVSPRGRPGAASGGPARPISAGPARPASANPARPTRSADDEADADGGAAGAADMSPRHVGPFGPPPVPRTHSPRKDRTPPPRPPRQLRRECTPYSLEALTDRKRKELEQRPTSPLGRDKRVVLPAADKGERNDSPKPRAPSPRHGSQSGVLRRSTPVPSLQSLDEAAYESDEEDDDEDSDDSDDSDEEEDRELGSTDTDEATEEEIEDEVDIRAAVQLALKEQESRRRSTTATKSLASSVVVHVEVRYEADGVARSRSRSSTVADPKSASGGKGGSGGNTPERRPSPSLQSQSPGANGVFLRVPPSSTVQQMRTLLIQQLVAQDNPKLDMGSPQFLKKSSMLRSRLARYMVYRKVRPKPGLNLLLRSQDLAVWTLPGSDDADDLVLRAPDLRFLPDSHAQFVEMNARVRESEQEIAEAKMRAQLQPQAQLASPGEERTASSLSELEKVHNLLKRNAQEEAEKIRDMCIMQGYLLIRDSSNAKWSKRFCRLYQTSLRVFKKRNDKKMVSISEFGGEGTGEITITMSLDQDKRFIAMFNQVPSGREDLPAAQFRSILDIRADNADTIWDWIHALIHLCPASVLFNARPADVKKRTLGKKPSHTTFPSLKLNVVSPRKNSISNSSSSPSPRSPVSPGKPVLAGMSPRRSSKTRSEAAPWVRLPMKSMDVLSEAIRLSSAAHMEKDEGRDGLPSYYLLQAGTITDIIAVLLFHCKDRTQHIREVFGLAMAVSHYRTPSQLGGDIMAVWKKFEDRGFQCCGEEQLQENMIHFAQQLLCLPPYCFDANAGKDGEYRAEIRDAVRFVLSKRTDLDRLDSCKYEPLDPLIAVNQALTDSYDAKRSVVGSDGKQERMYWVDFEVSTIAQQLTAWEANEFRSIRWSELLDSRWQKKGELAPHLTRLSSRFNRVTSAVTSAVLLCPTPKGQQKVFRKLWRVLKRLMAYRNYSSACQIFTGLTHHSITRLTHMKELAHSEKLVNDINYISSVFSVSDNYRTYRAMSLEKPNLPLLAVTLRDLTFIAENPLTRPHDTHADVINFVRWRMAADAIVSLGLHDPATTSYELPFDINFQIALDNTKRLSSDEAYEMSCKQEPSVRNKSSASSTADMSSQLKRLSRNLRALEMDFVELKEGAPATAPGAGSGDLSAENASLRRDVGALKEEVSTLRQELEDSRASVARLETLLAEVVGRLDRAGVGK